MSNYDVTESKKALIVSELNSKLREVNMEVDAREPAFLSQLEAIQYLMEAEMNCIEYAGNMVKNFCRDVIEGRRLVGEEVNQLIQGRWSSLSSSSTLVPNKFSRFLWVILSTLMSVKIRVTKFKQGNLNLEEYGYPCSGIIHLMYYNSEFFFLRPLKRECDLRNSISNNKGDLVRKGSIKSAVGLRVEGYQGNYKTYLAPDNPSYKKTSTGYSNLSVNARAPTGQRSHIVDSCQQMEAKDDLNTKNKDLKLGLWPKAQDKSCFIKSYKKFQNNLESDSKFGVSDNNSNERRDSDEYRTEGPRTEDLASYQCFKVEQSTESSSKEPSLAKALHFIEQYQEQYKTLVRPYLNSHYGSKTGQEHENKVYEGRLKFYNEKMKFGFIIMNDKTQIFMHKDNMVRSKIYTKGLENTFSFFNILVRFKKVEHNNNANSKFKAFDIELVNFMPRKNVFNK